MEDCKNGGIRLLSCQEEGIRLDRYLAEQIPDLTRSYLQKLLKENLAQVNGKTVKANYKVKKGDQISLELPEVQEPEAFPEDLPLDILYEDEDVLLVNKPKGMVVHPAAGHLSGDRKSVV